MKRMITALALAVGISLTGGVLAADLGGAQQKNPLAPIPAGTWTGLYVGVHGGYSVATAELAVPGIAIDSLAAQGFCGGVHAGVHYQLPGSKLVPGVRGGYTLCDTEFSIGPGLLRASLDKGWSVDATLGLAFDSVKPYILGGFTRRQVSADIVGTPVAGLGDFDGKRIGAGLDWRPPSMGSVSIAPEYVFTRFDDQTYAGGLLTVKTNEHFGGLRLNWHFGGNVANLGNDALK